MSKDWKHLTSEEYRKETAKLVHFNAKTVNSNAALVGIRLDKTAALDAPYVCLRTLIGSDVPIRLDYGEGGAGSAGTVKQINSVLVPVADEVEEAFVEERRAIEEGMAQAQTCSYSIGIEHVDHRLRQILVPNADATGGYVSLTPITAGGLCTLFFEKETGLVQQHNAAVKKDRDGTQRTIRQAQFGIGGSNPQNIGSLVRNMQRPLFVGAPSGTGSTKEAFFIYHRGITLDVHAPGELHNAVLDYVRFREANLKNDVTVTLRERQQEEFLVRHIAEIILDMASRTLNILQEHADILPKEDRLPDPEQDRYALVSPKMKPPVLRALLDPELRPLLDNWPRAMARFVVTCLLTSRKGSTTRLLVLDTSGRASLESLMEECFR